MTSPFPVVFPNNSFDMDSTSALDARVAFLQALALAQNISALTEHLPRIAEQDDPRIRSLANLVANWRNSLTWLQRCGLAAKPALPPPDLHWP